MLSTAWSRTDPFWTAWDGDDDTFIRLQATADRVDFFDAELLASERLNLGEDAFKREYLGIPAGAHTSPFGWELYERATTPHVPLEGLGQAFAPVEPRGRPDCQSIHRWPAGGRSPSR